MRSTKTAVYLAPAVADEVVVFNGAGPGGLAAYLTVENLDTLASSPIKYQESNDKSTWSDITGTVATVNPGDSNGQIVVSSASFIRLHAGGNVSLLVTVSRTVNGAPRDLGTA